MFSAVAQSVDATSVQWAAGCCALSGAFYGALRVGLKGRDDVDFATRRRPRGLSNLSRDEN